MDYGLDESYTPQHIVLKAGLQEPELTDVFQGTVKKATGWLMIDLQQESTYTIHSLHGDEKDEKEDEEAETKEEEDEADTKEEKEEEIRSLSPPQARYP